MGKNINNDIHIVKLAVTQLPKLTIDYSRNIVKYGVKNDFPSYLLFLYKNHPMHGGIVNQKVRYLSGKGIKAEVETPNTEAFLDRANSKEDWYELKKKLDKDEVLSGGFFLLVRTNAIGLPLEYHHLSFAKCRISPCQTIISYSEDWNKLYEYPAVQFPLWRKNIVGDSVYVYKSYAPNKTLIEGTYPDPEYVSCLIDIDTGIRIGAFSSSLVKNNFSAGNVITVRNGETDKGKQKTITEGLSFNYEGEENAGKSVVIFAGKDAGATDIQSINTNDQDKQYVEVNKRAQQNILTSHGVNGALFKIITEGNGLNTTSELAFAQEQFITEYVKVKQESVLEIIEMFYELRYSEEVEFEIEQVNPIGLDFTDANINKYMTNDEIRERLNLPVSEKIESTEAQKTSDALNTLSPLVANKVLESMTEDEIRQLIGLKSKTAPVIDPLTGKPSIIAASTPVNENIKNLSGRQFQGLMRIVKKYDDKKISKESAIALMTAGFGVSEEEAKTFLNIADEDEQTLDNNIQQSMVDKPNLFFTLFEKYAHDINDEDEIIDVQECKMGEAVKFDSQLNNAVLEQIKGNPTVKPEEIAKATDSTLEQVQDAIKKLIVLGLIAEGLKAFEIKPKALNKDTESTEVYTEYVYAKRSDVKGDILLSTSRPFCVNLVSLTKRKALSYEAILNLENEFGENAWDYRGGFYNNGKETTPWCRHVWSAVTKIRRKK